MFSGAGQRPFPVMAEAVEEVGAVRFFVTIVLVSRA